MLLLWALLAVIADIGWMEPRTAWSGDGIGIHCDVVVSCTGAEVRSLLFLDRWAGDSMID